MYIQGQDVKLVVSGDKAGEVSVIQIIKGLGSPATQFLDLIQKVMRNLWKMVRSLIVIEQL